MIVWCVRMFGTNEAEKIQGCDKPYKDNLEKEKKGMNDKIYPRTSDNQTVYLKNVVTNANIEIGDYTMYNDFVHDPLDFEKNNVL